jgi:hypothetical protein
VFGHLAGSTAVLALAVGFLVTIIDCSDFHSLGDGVWSAVVTMGTVGYGDTVPHTGSGWILGSVVIVAGVTFITFLNATVTSPFVSADQQELTRKSKVRHAASEQLRRALLKRLLERLEAIEEKLGQKRG